MGAEGTTGDITDGGSAMVSFLSVNVVDSIAIDKLIISTAINTPVTSDSVDKLIIESAINTAQSSPQFSNSIVKNFSSDYTPVKPSTTPIKFTARIL